MLVWRKKTPRTWKLQPKEPKRTPEKLKRRFESWEGILWRWQKFNTTNTEDLMMLQKFRKYVCAAGTTRKSGQLQHNDRIRSKRKRVNSYSQKIWQATKMRRQSDQEQWGGNPEIVLVMTVFCTRVIGSFLNYDSGSGLCVYVYCMACVGTSCIVFLIFSVP